MVPSSTLGIAVDGDCLTCSGFSLGETVHLGSFKFITDYICGLSLPPRRGNSGVALTGGGGGVAVSASLSSVTHR
jgi:hypothetical protein